MKSEWMKVVFGAVLGALLAGGPLLYAQGRQLEQKADKPDVESAQRKLVEVSTKLEESGKKADEVKAELEKAREQMTEQRVQQAVLIEQIKALREALKER